MSLPMTIKDNGKSADFVGTKQNISLSKDFLGELFKI